jgi:cation diffusion facilitator family transporter
LTPFEKFERKTLWVVLLTAMAMIIEIGTGLITGSMALLADGIHMSSHVFAIGLSWIAYVFIRKKSSDTRYNNNTNKILSLSSYTSGLILMIFAVMIIVRAATRFFSPVSIEYREAIIVAFAGLIVNILSAFLLHHEKHEADTNIRAAYLHVLADTLTSVSAIIGLTAAMIWNITYIDTIAAMISSFVIIKWSVGLLIESSKDLINLK